MNLPDCWEALSDLQRNLKKQFLLVEKEQQEKVKLKREIEQLVRSYHKNSVELSCPGGEVLKQQGFDNCYNFIKDVAITISTNYQLGKLIILLAQEKTVLPQLIIHGLYQNIETNDIFSKNITRLMHSLLGDLLNGDLSVVKRQKIVDAWRLYMQKIELITYFSQIAEEVLKQLLDQNQQVGAGLQLKKSTTTYSTLQRPPKIAIKSSGTLPYQQLVNLYLHKIESEAEMCLAGIKIPLKAICSGPVPSSPELRKVWRLLSHFYLAPFLKIASKSSLDSQSKERILRFVDELVQNWGFTAQLTYKSFETVQRTGDEVRLARIDRICGKLLRVNQEERFKDFMAGVGPSSNQIQIRILGGCFSLYQLYELLILINSHREQFSKISQKIINRTIKIFEISPNLKVLHRERAALQFASLSELRYEQSIDSDYYKNYTLVYRGQTLKQMLKQVLVEISNLKDFRAEHRNTLPLIFKSLEKQHDLSQGGIGITAQLLMKIRYLIYLLAKEQNPCDHKLLVDMLADLQKRNSINFKLFENTKFSLLKVYCNLRNIKSMVRHQKDSEKKAQSRIRLIQQLEELRLDICITSKASRNKSQEGDKYRYRMSNADDILIVPTTDCIHKDNPFTGRQNHPSTISKFIKAFTSLDELKYYLRHPSFLNKAQQDNPYLYSSQAKFGQALTGFLQILFQKLSLPPEDKTVVEEVIFRLLAEELLGTHQQPLSNFYDRCLNETVVFEDCTDIQSPRKSKAASKKRRSSFEQLQKIGEDQIGAPREQLYAMGRRYLQSLGEVSSPADKMRRLRDLMQVYRIALSHQGKVEQSLLLQLLVRTMALSRTPNLISQLAYLQMFVPEQKMMLSDGRVLKQLQKAASKAIEESVRGRQNKQ